MTYSIKTATFAGLDLISLWEWEKEMGNKKEDKDTSSPPPNCSHQWVNVSLHQIVMACKYCGVDKLTEN